MALTVTEILAPVGQGASPATILTATFSGSANVGDIVFVTVLLGSTGVLPTPTDSAGNTYVLDNQDSSTTATMRHGIAYCRVTKPIVGGVTTLSVSTAAIEKGMAAFVVQAPGLILELDKNNHLSSQATGTTLTTGASGVLVTPYEFVIASYGWGNQDALFTEPAGWTNPHGAGARITTTSVVFEAATVYLLPTATTSLNPAATLDTTNPWEGLISTYAIRNAYARGVPRIPNAKVGPQALRYRYRPPSVATAVDAAPSNIVTDAGADQLTVAPSGSETIIDAGVCATAKTASAAELLIDQGADAATVVPSGVDAPADAGTAAASGSMTVAGEAIVDQGAAAGTVTLAVTGELLADAGTTVAVAALSSVELLIDQGALTATVTPTAIDAPAEGGTVGTTGTQTAAEALVDASTVTAAVSLTPSEIIADQAAAVILVSLSRAEAIVDGSTVTVVVSLSGQEQVVTVGSDAGTVTVTVTTSGGETLIDQAALVATTIVAAVELVLDQGALGGAVTPSAAESIADQGTVTATATMTVGGVTYVEAGNTVALATGTATELLAESASLAVTVTPSASSFQNPYIDAGTVTALVTLTGVDSAGTRTDAGTIVATVTASGFAYVHVPGALDTTAGGRVAAHTGGARVATGTASARIVSSTHGGRSGPATSGGIAGRPDTTSTRT